MVKKIKTAICKLKSMSPYSQSKYTGLRMCDFESFGDYDKRTMLERCHWDDSGRMFIPRNSFLRALATSAKMAAGASGEALFIAGVMLTGDMQLQVTRESVEFERQYVGCLARPGAHRHSLRFPVVKQWEGQAEFLVSDDAITQRVFEWHLIDAGNRIGIGRNRPYLNGTYGRFSAESVRWK